MKTYERKRLLYILVKQISTVVSSSRSYHLDANNFNIAHVTCTSKQINIQCVSI